MPPRPRSLRKRRSRSGGERASTIPKTVAALDSGTVPDVAYSDSYDVQAQGKWAFEGKLEDLSDILVPMKSAFAPNTLETALLYNDVAKKKAYYGFPLKQ